MSKLSDNLQYYRKKRNITQEQLAEQMNVSRQTVSKWESDTSYPEMEKLLQICDLFSCSLDTLLRDDAGKMDDGVLEKYDKHMKERTKSITTGVVLLVFDAALYELTVGIGLSEAVANTLFLVFAIIAAAILCVQGMKHETFRKRNPNIAFDYRQEEREHVEDQFPKKIVTGIVIIMIGILIGANAENLPGTGSMTEDFFYGIVLLFVAAGTGVLVYAGLTKERYHIANYNRENDMDEDRKKKNTLVGIWCGCIMCAATIIFVVCGFCFSGWGLAWVVFPVGALLCGIVSIIVNGRNPAQS